MATHKTFIHKSERQTYGQLSPPSAPSLSPTNFDKMLWNCGGGVESERRKHAVCEENSNGEFRDGNETKSGGAYISKVKSHMRNKICQQWQSTRQRGTRHRTEQLTWLV